MKTNHEFQWIGRFGIKTLIFNKKNFNKKEKNLKNRKFDQLTMDNNDLTNKRKKRKARTMWSIDFYHHMADGYDFHKKWN
jgi:hypothetical protein